MKILGNFFPWVVFPAADPCFCALQALQVASLSSETLEVTNEELHELQGDKGTRLGVTARGWSGTAAKLNQEEKQNLTCGLQQFQAGNRNSFKKKGFGSRKSLVLADLL